MKAAVAKPLTCEVTHWTRPSVKTVLVWVVCIMLPVGVLLALAYLPPLNPFKRPHFDLTGPVAQAAYWLAESGSARGIPFLAIGLIAVLISRSGISGKERVVEALAIALVLASVLGLGAYINEYFVKRVFAIPRPNIIELAETPTDAPALKMSAKEFYGLGEKAVRSEYMKKVLTPELKMDDHIRSHWIFETGYSFPSGHSYSSMTFATLFLALGLSCSRGRRRWVFYVFPVWAIAVCFSRPILRVHSPTDILVGGFEGIAAGMLAFLLFRWLVESFTPRPAEAPQ